MRSLFITERIQIWLLMYPGPMRMFFVLTSATFQSVLAHANSKVDFVFCLSFLNNTNITARWIPGAMLSSPVLSCADLARLSLGDLQHDLLIIICNDLHSSDLKNLRLVDKECHAAVDQSAITLRPHRSLPPSGLVELGQLFRNAAGLNLSRCQQLSDECLRGLSQIFPCLKELSIWECTRLTAKGIAHLAELSQLESLLVLDSYLGGLKELPNTITGLVSLRHLNLPCCRRLRSLPGGLSELVSLRSLNLIECDSLEYLPEGIGSLTLLRCLSLRGCRRLVELPNCISGLISLEGLHASDCQRLASLPSAIGCLTALTELELGGCGNLMELPASLRGLSKLLYLDLPGCRSLAALPAGLSVLTALRILNLGHCTSLVELPEGLIRLAPQTRVWLGGCPAEAGWLAGAGSSAA